jgi:hypothetical protein
MPKRHLPLFLAAALVAVPLGAARASGDSCDSPWALDFAAKPQCSNIPALVPGNDTRSNLLILLADRHRMADAAAPAQRPTLDWPEFRDAFEGLEPDAAPAGYADGEGSRCLSNAAGEQAFSAAVSEAAGILPEERDALVRARADLKPSCAADASGAPPLPDVALPGVPGSTAREFAAYLKVTAAFYAGRFDEAKAGAVSLASSANAWVSDTADYMVARIAVNRMQVDAYDQYGTFKGPSAVDQSLARDAEAAIEAYVAARPKGRYVASATGLQRRVYWLAGWTDRLAARYAALLALPPTARDMTDAALAEEIDNKLLPTLQPAMTRDPTLLAVLDLFAIRVAAKGTPQPPRPDLSEQREAFAGNPDLLGFLEGVLALYGDDNPKAVIAGIPDDARRKGGDHLWFSRQFLRGMALEEAGDRNARGFWKEMIAAASRPLDRSTLELAYALNVDRRGEVDEAFKAGSPLANPAIRSILLVNGAGPDLLRARATDASAAPRERQVGLFTLLRKELTHGQYAGFLRDVALVPPKAPTEGDVRIDPLGDAAIPSGLFTNGKTAGDIGCPRLAQTASDLAGDPAAIRPRLCLSEWIRLNGFDPDFWSAKPRKPILGSGPSGYPGDEATRGSIYASVIADDDATPDERAYALYRAVKCYEPSGYNTCGGADVPKAERRRWYSMLKRGYTGSRWARELRFWW